jgi:hypothetical protein
MKKLLALVPLALALVGCSQPNVPLKQSFWKNHQQHVAVTTNKVPKAGLYKEGAQGLLDMAINDADSTGFRHYLESYKLNNLSSELRTNFVKGLKKHNIKAKRVARIDTEKLDDSGLNKTQYAIKDYRPLAIKIGPEKLLIVSINAAGATRKYYGFIPLGAPKAFCNLEGHLVNLNNDKILWRYTAKVYVPIQGNWDQPPRYPNFTAALNQAVELAKQEVTDNFFYANKS